MACITVLCLCLVTTLVTSASLLRACNGDKDRCFTGRCSTIRGVTHVGCWRGKQLLETKPAMQAFGQLSQRVRGQDDALSAIQSRLRIKLHNPLVPAVLHFAGDNGVGKSLLAKLISKALFHRGHPYIDSAGDGFLQVETAAFLHVSVNSSMEDQKAARAALLAPIRDHLRQCPHGVVLIDELENLQAPVVSVISSLINGRVDDVSTNQALIILTSDFGKAGAMAGKSREEIRKQVHRFTKELYGEPALADKVEIVPFVTPGLEEFRKIALARFEQLPCEVPDLKCVEFDSEAVESVALKAWNGIREKNGREVDEKFAEYVRAPILHLLDDLPQQSGFRVLVTGDPPVVEIDLPEATKTNQEADF